MSGMGTFPTSAVTGPLAKELQQEEGVMLDATTLDSVNLITIFTD